MLRKTSPDEVAFLNSSESGDSGHDGDGNVSHLAKLSSVFLKKSGGVCGILGATRRYATCAKWSR